VLALPESGCKTRVVTMSPEPTLCIGHEWRGRLWSLLDKNPIFHLSNSTIEGLWELTRLKAFGATRPAWLFVSSDLTQATDYMPHDVSERFIRGLEEHYGSPLDELRGILLSQNLEYHDGTRIASTRGSLMGLPMSWLVLSV
jgi:hypothetical protein